jgi:hypothetical protein
MSANQLTRREQRAQAQHFIDTLEGTAFPNSKRIYITGSSLIFVFRCAKSSLARRLSAARKTTPIRRK